MASPETLERWSKSTKEDQQKGMMKWKEWMDAHQADFADGGVPLDKNKRIDVDGIKDERNGICGYSIVQANSHEAAAEIFKDSPHIEEQGAWVDVLPCLEMK